MKRITPIALPENRVLSLRELQLRFVAALYEGNDAIVADQLGHPGEPGISAAARIGVYRNNLREGFIKALAIDYPVVEKLVGPEFFRQTALDFQLQHPSVAGDLAQVGAPFADYLRRQFADGDYGWLPDVAALEWALQCVAIAPDREAVSVARLSEIPPQRYEDLVFEPAPATRLVESRYPVVRIWQTNQPHAGAENVDLNSGPDRVLVRRRGDELEFVRLSSADFTFARMLARRTPLGLATDASLAIDPAFDLGRALRALALAGAFAGIGLDH
jgi:hypothetical protein